MKKGLRIIIITGLSGSGKSTVSTVLEDEGYFCVDNMPVLLLPKFIELCEQTAEISKIAMVMDIRSGEFFGQYAAVLEDIESEGYKPEILFLEASNEILQRRFNETRRPHPLAEGRGVVAGIRRERELLVEIRQKANLVLNTSDFDIPRLKKQIKSVFAKPSTRRRMQIALISFGYSFGIPSNADVIIDVRFLPNPYYTEELRYLTGNDQAVVDFVMMKEVAKEFLDRFVRLLAFLIPRYEEEGKAYIRIAVGCTGGHHRSVTIVNQLEHHMKAMSRQIRVEHRDIERG